jgi:hypothetical protein
VVCPATSVVSAPVAAGQVLTTLGLPASSVRAAMQRHEAEHARERPLFQPQITAAAARLHRTLPVEEMLLGKAQAAAKKRERAIAAQALEERRSLERTERAPSATDALARRYIERVGQTASERLYAPRSRTPSGRAAAKASMIGSAHATPRMGGSHERAMRAVARSGSAFHTIPNSAVGPRSAGSISSIRCGSADAVAERSATWAQAREQRVMELANRQRKSERDECTFKPAVHGGDYLAAVGASMSSLDVVERGRVWQAAREMRLESARNADLSLQMGGGQCSSPQRTPLSPSRMPHAYRGGEPRFMAPTTSARERVADTLPVKAAYAYDYVGGEVLSGSLPVPEWAAPRG